jgi:hypothetical protein
VGQVEVGVHLQLGHLVGQVQKGLGVHGFRARFSALFSNQ